MRAPRARMSKLLKPLVFTAALSPVVYLLFRAFTGRLTANPVEDLTLTTGIWALRLLLVTLAITPFRRLTGWHGVIKYRRVLGLFTFFYASMHLLVYVVFDQALDVRFILPDIVKRPYITAGMTAFALMVPLAITSTRGWIRRLGRRWQLLHRLVYFSGAAACLHFIWKVKVVVGEPVYYAAIFATLIALRAIWWLRSPARARRQTAEA